MYIRVVNMTQQTKPNKMKQVSQIGKRTKKEEYLLSKKGRIFITPKNREYIFDYVKEKNKYFYIINYNGNKMKVKENEYNTIDTDILIDLIIEGLKIK